MEETVKNESDNDNINENLSENRPLPEQGGRGISGKPGPEDLKVSPPAAIPDPDPETQLGSESAAPASMVPEDIPELPWIKSDTDAPDSPEVNLPGEGAPHPEIGLPPRPRRPKKTEKDELKDTRQLAAGGEIPGEGATYRWTYGEELRHADNKRRSGAGVLIYAIVMTIAFALTLTLMLGVVLYESGAVDSALIRRAILREVERGNLDFDFVRTIYIRDSAGDELSIPEIYAKVLPSVVGIAINYPGEALRDAGTGFVLSSDGYIATNYHVVEGGEGFMVTTSDGEQYEAVYVGGDELSDLAVLKIEASGLVPAVIGDSDNLIEGEAVYALGNPGGLEYANSLTSGIVSSRYRQQKVYNDAGVLEKKMVMIQTSASVNPGNSGGPLVNERGEVIGIITSKLIVFYESMGFAIPINGSMIIYNEIIETGEARSGYLIASKRAVLGITAHLLEDGATPGGVVKGEVYNITGKDETAAASGMLVEQVDQSLGSAGRIYPGDIITHIGNRRVYKVSDIIAIVNNYFEGDTIEITLCRGGEVLSVRVTLSVNE